MLTACLAGAGRAGPYQTGDQPGWPRLGAALPAGHTSYDNDSLANLFVSLTHGLEWGARRPHLVRYEEPVSVGLYGSLAPQYARFVDRSLSEFSARSGVDIKRDNGAHNLLIRFVPGQDFRSEIEAHFCLVAPGRLTWETFRSNPARFGTRAFENQRKIEAMTVFIPDNAEPYLVRTCLIEEIVQALGPANDLYGLGPSIFNDDAAHVWPTRLDYLMLRVLYQPDMRTGLSSRATRARAKTALDRLNPEGRTARPLPKIITRDMRKWAAVQRKVFDRTRSMGTRLEDAKTAAALARGRAPGSAYHCRSLMALARVSGDTPDNALVVIDQALEVCGHAHGPDDIRIHRLMLDKARMLYAKKDYLAAYRLTEPLEAQLAAFGQDERLVALYALQAASLRAIQQSTKSFEARRRAGEWGAYALGRDHPDVRKWQLSP